MKHFLVSLMLCTLSLAANAQTYDLVNLKGRVIDPETGLDSIRNVSVIEDEIAAISENPMEGEVVLDATDLGVAPGSIDLHAHGQNIGDYRMLAVQSVTTALELEPDVLPIVDWYDGQATKNIPINYGASAAWTFGRIAAFLGEGPFATVEYFQDAQARDDWKSEIATGRSGISCSVLSSKA